MDVLGERVPVYQSSPICAIRCFYTLSSKMDLGNELIGGGAVMGFQFHIHTSDLVFLQGHSLSENCV